VTNREGLEAIIRREQLDQRTIRQLLGQGLITVSDVTNLQTPLGKREYLATGLTLRGQLLLDKVGEKSPSNVKRGEKGKEVLRNYSHTLK
jgi:hypothetical protein